MRSYLLFPFVFEVLIRTAYSQCSINGILVSSSGPCTYDVEVDGRVYKDKDYTQERQLPIEISDELEVLYMRFQLLSTSRRDASHLLLERCWATSSEESFSNSRSSILTWPGCVYFNYREVIVLRDNGGGSRVEVQFPVFFLQRTSAVFYLHCSVGVTRESPKCSSSSFFQDSAPPFLQSSEMLTLGPFVRRQREDIIAETKNRERLLIDVMHVLVVLLNLFILFILGFSLWRCYKSKRGSYNLKSDSKSS